MKPSIYQRKSDGKWVGTIDITSTRYANPSKKRDRITVYGSNKKEVQSKANEIIYEIEHDLYKRKTNDSLISFLEMYIEMNKKLWEDTTYSLYKMYINTHIEPYFKSTKLDNIKPIDIDKFYDYKREKLSNNTVLKLHKFLNAAFNYGVKKDILRNNVIGKATPPKEIRYDPVICDQEQFLLLWSSLEHDIDKVYIAIAAGVGLRRGEICGLTWDNIDFKNSTISIVNTVVRFDKNIEKDPKNETSKRTVYAPKYVMDVLKSYKANTEVFDINNRIIPYKPQYLSERFRKLLIKYNLQHIRLHDLRHFNATMMMNAGIPDKVAASRLGHAQTETLKRVYQHALDGMNKEASDILNNVFENRRAK